MDPDTVLIGSRLRELFRFFVCLFVLFFFPERDFKILFREKMFILQDRQLSSVFSVIYLLDMIESKLTFFYCCGTDWSRDFMIGGKKMWVLIPWGRYRLTCLSPVSQGVARGQGSHRGLSRSVPRLGRQPPVLALQLQLLL